MPIERRDCFLLLLGGALAVSACGARGSYDPIPDASARAVEAPSALAVLSQSSAISGVPAAITFGGPRGGSALYLKFPDAWREHGAPRRAYLALEPLAGEPPESESVRVEVWRVRAAWQPGALRNWSDKPELAPPYASVVTASSPSRTLRIDVTELLRFAANNPDLDQGMALIASSGNGHGASFTTGISGGAAPRLEVYQR